MGFIVLTKGRKGAFLFLVDRHKTKNRWWDTSLSQAMLFQKESAAKIQAEKLKHRDPEVISLNEARILEKLNDGNSELMTDYDPGDSEYWNSKD